MTAPIFHCESDGTELRLETIREHDFSAFAGINVQLEAVPGYRCPSCGEVVLPGAVINAVLVAIARSALLLPHRLPAPAARYLRRCLQVTQQELANRMGIARETVAQWERGEREISPQHDLILRTLLVNRWYAQKEPKLLVDDAVGSLVSVHSEPPPPRTDDPLRMTIADYTHVAQSKHAPQLQL